MTPVGICMEWVFASAADDVWCSGKLAWNVPDACFLFFFFFRCLVANVIAPRWNLLLRDRAFSGGKVSERHWNEACRTFLKNVIGAENKVRNVGSKVYCSTAALVIALRKLFIEQIYRIFIWLLSLQELVAIISLDNVSGYTSDTTFFPVSHTPFIKTNSTRSFLWFSFQLTLCGLLLSTPCKALLWNKEQCHKSFK